MLCTLLWIGSCDRLFVTRSDFFFLFLIADNRAFERAYASFRWYSWLTLVQIVTSRHDASEVLICIREGVRWWSYTKCVVVLRERARIKPLKHLHFVLFFKHAWAGTIAVFRFVVCIGVSLDHGLKRSVFPILFMDRFHALLLVRGPVRQCLARQTHQRILAIVFGLVAWCGRLHLHREKHVIFILACFFTFNCLV